VLPGGENGGAKIMTLELIRVLARTTPDCEFVLLTLARNDDELAVLDAPNVRRLRVDTPGPMLAPSHNLRVRVRNIVRALIPPRLLERLSAGYQKQWNHIPLKNNPLRRLGADLLFCPFTAPNFYDPTVPIVSIIHDLQHRYYPQYFDPADLQQRDRGFQETCRAARYIVCISRYVRKTILENANIAPERIETIPIMLPHRLSKPPVAEMEAVLRSLGLQSEKFLLYPANFWPHKNHEVLLDAFRAYLVAHSDADLKLALTGAPGPRHDLILETCRGDTLLSSRVVFPGYLAERQFSVLLHACRAIVFPSLFEGFGMPLLEGMAAGKPLLVSDRTSLPEIAGDAALYFDPTRPSEIADAIRRVERDPDLRCHLAERAAKRLRAFGGPEEMAARYLQVFRSALLQPGET
jgi:glycosyltransferase involved in cell wall biosynthesis